MTLKKVEQSFGQKPDSHPESAARTFESLDTYDDRGDHILQAAASVMARDGYGQASMRAVAGVAGVSLAGIYHYFDSKEKMLFLIQYRTFNSLLANLREKLLDVPEPREQIAVMIRSHVSYFASNMDALRVCSHEMESVTGAKFEELSRIRREYYDLTRSIIERIIEKSKTPENGSDPHVATMCLFGMLNWLYRWYDPARQPSVNNLANQITSQFLSGIENANAPSNRLTT